MNPHDLMAVARALAESDRALPLQATLRRAVSTAYYALFHCLAASAADLFHRHGTQSGVAQDLPRAGARQG